MSTTVGYRAWTYSCNNMPNMVESLLARVLKPALAFGHNRDFPRDSCSVFQPHPRESVRKTC